MLHFSLSRSNPTDAAGDRVAVAGSQQVKGQPLRGAAADPRKLGQLGDQALDRWCVHAWRKASEARESETAEAAGDSAEL